MANHKSALKRAKQNLDRRTRNRSTKTRIKKVVKDVRLAASETTGEAVGEKLDAAKSIIDNAAKKGVIHKKSAARKISRLSRLVNTISA